MATRAYVLVETNAGQIHPVVEALHKMPGLIFVDPVAGPYDVIAVFEADDLAAVGDLVTTHVQTIPGINRTLTCLSLA